MERKLKVYAVPGKVTNIPQIRLQGKWLKELGYEVGDEIIIKTEDDGKIIITKKEA